MGFYNKKEQVIEIQLTQFGKELLAKGKFKPEYYAFFDGDILYDGLYANLVEVQNDIQTRIKEDTPSIELQYNFGGVEAQVKETIRKIRTGQTSLQDNAFQSTPDKHFSLIKSLGNSSLSTDKAPSWNIRMLNGGLSGSIEYLSGSQQIINIPQLSSSINYEIKVGYLESIKDINLEDIEKIYEDESFIDVKEDYILIEAIEDNTDFLNENFDIEIFEIKKSEISKTQTKEQENLIPLSFVKRGEKVNKNLILVEDDNEEVEVPELDPSYVEYFFDILVDKEIPREIMCKHRNQDKSKGVFSDDLYDCEEFEKDKLKNIYDREVEEFEDCE